MHQPFLPADFTLSRSTALIGPYGSGKSELALALARLMARRIGRRGGRHSKVALGDVDVLKPYFRAREAGESLRAEGVQLLAPAGDLAGADLPILTPELRGAMGDDETLLILDVGGDPAGARALGAMRDAMAAGQIDLWLVLNKNRPFMQRVQDVAAQAGKIQRASGLDLTGIVSNTHLMEETALDDVIEGLDFARRVGLALGVPVRLVGLNREMAELMAREGRAGALQGLPAIVLERALKPAFLGGCALRRTPP